MSCVQLRLKEIPSKIPNRHVKNGFVYIDTDAKFDLSETKRIEELTELGKLKFNYSIEVDLPLTNKNFSIFKHFPNPNVLDNDLSALPIEVVKNSHISQDTSVYLTNFKKTQISIKINLSLEHWARQAENTCPQDLDFGTFTFSLENIIDVIENTHRYTSGNGIYFPACNYGESIRSSLQYNSDSNTPTVDLISANEYTFPREFFRPWFHLTSLFEKMYCSWGYEFKSPFFESDLGRQTGTYLLKRDLGVSLTQTITSPVGDIEVPLSDSLDFKAVNLGNSAATYYMDNRAGHVIFQDIEYDNGEHLQENGLYVIPEGQTGGIVNVVGRASFGFYNADDPLLSEVNTLTAYVGYLEVGSPDSFRVVPLKQETFEIAAGGTGASSHSFEFDLESVPIVAGDRFGIFFIVDDRSAFQYVNIAADLTIEGVSTFLPEDQEIELNELVSCELNNMEIIKEYARALNIKFITDPVQKTVTWYTPYTKKWFPDNIEGFYIEDDIHSLTNYIDEKSKDVNTPNLEEKRYRLLGFNPDHENDWVSSKEYDGPMWSRKVDLGPLFKNETIPWICENIEPVVNDKNIHIPRFNKNDEGWTYDIGLTFVIFHGDAQQSVVGRNQPILRLKTGRRVTIPTAYQFTPPSVRLSDHGGGGLFLTPEANLVYNSNIQFLTSSGRRVSLTEVEVAKNLYTLCYQRWMKEELAGLEIKYLIDYNFYRFKSEDFRRIKTFLHMGRPIRARLTELYDYKFCSRTLIPATFKAVIQTTDLKGLVEPSGEQTFECYNAPIILVTRDELGCLQFALGGINNAAITSVTFYYKVVGTALNVFLTNTSPTTAELCGQTESISVNALVDYDGCPNKITPTVIIDRCSSGGVNIVVSLDYVRGTQVDVINGIAGFSLCARLEGTAEIISGTYQEFQFLDPPAEGDLGTQPQTLTAYNPNTTPCIHESLWDTLAGSGNFFNKVQIKWIVRTAPDCDPIEITYLYEPLLSEGRSDLDCSRTNAFLTYESNLFVLNGVIVGSEDQWDYSIKYRTSADGITYTNYQLWDNVTTVIADFVQARLIVEWDDDNCPHYFSDLNTTGDECGCTDVDLFTLQIDCDVEGNMTYTLTNGEACDTPVLASIKWEKGVYLSGVVTEYAGNTGTIIITESGDYRVTLYFENGCFLSSPIIDIPYSGNTTNIAGK